MSCVSTPDDPAACGAVAAGISTGGAGGMAAAPQHPSAAMPAEAALRWAAATAREVGACGASSSVMLRVTR